MGNARPTLFCSFFDTTRLFCDVTGQWVDAAKVDCSTLAPGDRLRGPALIAEPQTTTLVSADFVCAVDALHNLVLIRQEATHD